MWDGFTKNEAKKLQKIIPKFQAQCTQERPLPAYLFRRAHLFRSAQ
jgi:hypothetical protein